MNICWQQKNRLSGPSWIFPIKLSSFQSQLIFSCWTGWRYQFVCSYYMKGFQSAPFIYLDSVPRSMIGINHSFWILVSMGRKPPRSHLMLWVSVLFRLSGYRAFETLHSTLAGKIYLSLLWCWIIFCLISNFSPSFKLPLSFVSLVSLLPPVFPSLLN